MGCVGYRYNIKRAGNFDPSQRLSCIVMKLLRYQEQTNRKSQLLVSGNPSSKHSSSTSCPDSTAEQTSDAVLQLHTTSPYLFQPVSGLGSCDLSFQDPRDSDPYPKHYLKINQTNRHFYPFSPNLNETGMCLYCSTRSFEPEVLTLNISPSWQAAAPFSSLSTTLSTAQLF